MIQNRKQFGQGMFRLTGREVMDLLAKGKELGLEMKVGSDNQCFKRQVTVAGKHKIHYYQKLNHDTATVYSESGGVSYRYWETPNGKLASLTPDQEMDLIPVTDPHEFAARMVNVRVRTLEAIQQ